MKLLADECCTASLVQRLRAAGHDVVWIGEVAGGIADEEVLEAAFAERRVVVTDDKDLGELVVRQQRPVEALVLLRSGAGGIGALAERLVRLLAMSAGEMPGHLVVVTERKVRFRNLDRRR